MQKFTTYHQAIAFLEGLSNLPTKNEYLINRENLDAYLKRMRYFLNLLDNPDKNLKFIHITGTAGKGSVTNMLHEVLHASGKKVGSFTSPYVTTSIEKIRVGETYIPPTEFAAIVESIKPAIDKAYLDGPYGHPSYFEIFLAIALIYFKNKKCEWVVLEVGLGGRYDATNVINNPIVTAITNIDYDHMEILGDTLQKIAHDKAGIIKPRSLFFTSEQRSPIIKIFKDICFEKNAQFHQVPHQTTYIDYNQSLVRMISLALKIKDIHIDKGIEKNYLQCRFEIMEKKPFVILDGAHNRAKVSSTMVNLKQLTYKKLFLIVAMAENKEHYSILEQIVPSSDHIFFTRFQVKERKCAHPKELLEKSRKYIKRGTKTNVYLDCHRALSEALKLATKDDAILVVGSFFLAGELRKKWYPEEYILTKRTCI